MKAEAPTRVSSRTPKAKGVSKATKVAPKKAKAAPTKAAKKGKDESDGESELSEMESVEEDESSVEEPAAVKYSVGEVIESIKLLNQESVEIDLLEVASANGVVIFFYPKASTPGCTSQACLFRDSYAEFEKLGYKIFGCSADSPKSQLNFKTKKEFQYDLLSDPKKILIDAIGAKNGASITRSHVVIAKGGKVLDIVLKVSPKDSAVKALASASK